MSKIKLILFVFVLIACGSAYSVFANNATPVVSIMKAFLVKKNAQGNEYHQPVSEAKSGELVEYNMTNRSQTKEPLQGFVIDVPIPLNTTYITRSVSTKVSSMMTVSIDGGRYFERGLVRR